MVKNFLMNILLLSASLVFGLMFFTMLYHGIKTGEVYHTSGLPPIYFKTNPVRFVLWCICLVVIIGAMSAGAYFMIRKIIQQS